MIVRDTNVVSETMRPLPDAAVVAWLNRQEIRTLHLTAVSLAELRFGIARLEEGRTRADLLGRLKLMDRVFARRILPFTAAAAQASIAASGFSIATRDTAPFEAMGLAVTNPWDEAAP